MNDAKSIGDVVAGVTGFANSDMDAVGTAVAAHVAASYAREAALMTAINAADSVSALRSINLTAGWASVPPNDPGA